ncbi:cytochrome c3 family protein [Tuwongella immobilis]|uniref:Cytochrome c7-like domain-containing protein n=1 Tax=Tuwongella immobilis TaxID=692036 RepID=A0A6C2YNL3_9BACT|nr:cytochrome c3 family protein [Tuwongella immobilis]VIP02789.1 Quinol:cytochrome c oxidoreductase pentaheme cytochrome subunit OS=Isosphaera pallida (strain ATCC 43644 / DSM 9630 / IS1B) GN=Isop_0784 PE=4 SV=1: Cytochrome_C7: Cytochrome_C7 [Tuwongella immobilis]VTS02455.1 Quinol:cytochrome c oxidoreductase pentaheme cytochrome subunit OS=Isosphaera pallida (strain ATCC 43644 / DSM 9630 / IS1B) GN=Isop_0784 PE=4 SV=1: Cytochrome_C7: Cytochrome_C7 [Tuwongella immobilis]
MAVALGASLFYYYALPSYTRVGYAPEQPIPFSHQLHVGQLGMNCLYCHTQVNESPHSNVPNTQTCMNCHNPEKANVKGNSPLLALARESWRSGNPVQWKRIHKLPEYAYFNHAVHVNRGVSCVSCHGQINEMAVVYQSQPLSMGWCLTCHNNPEQHLRPLNEVYNMTWKPQGSQTQEMIGKQIKDQLSINPPQNCQGCHR